MYFKKILHPVKIAYAIAARTQNPRFIEFLKMKLIVQKFGGTSVADIERIRHVAKVISTSITKGNRVVVVVSAMSGVTNTLVSKCNSVSKLDNNSSLREYDAALASGEVVSASLLALELQNIGIKAQSLQSWQIPIITNEFHGNSYITEVGKTKLKNILSEGVTPIITGFQGVSEKNDVTTLGKGGSDTSAAIIAAALNADYCDIYTDVSGIYTVDPRIIHQAKKIKEITKQQLFALCSFGAKVLHPRAALAMLRYNINLRILSSFEKQFNEPSGTTTTNKIAKMEQKEVTAITSNKNLLKISVSYNGRYINVVSALLESGITISNICNKSSRQLEIITELGENSKSIKILSQLKDKDLIQGFDINGAISSVTIVGYALKHDKKLLGEILSLLDKEKIPLINVDITDLSISFFLSDEDVEQTIKLLHNHCFIIS
ncbi:MAG TPA: aspartate kinase [Candidatus Megaira endosymbiont of Nemacystus decipiens]|nr:aspartate kinase [Candidatus Megaera endosymbiont of Nemacystus decipiens]